MNSTVLDVTQLPDDGNALAQMLIDAILNKQYGLGAALLVMVLLLVFRTTIVPRFAGQVPWLSDKRVTLVLSVLGPVLGAIAAALLAGQAITVGLILSAVLTGLGAVGLWSGQKNWREASTHRGPLAGQPGGTVASLVAGKEPGQPLK